MSETKSDVNKCRHFNGIQRGKCEAGILYHDVSRVALEGQSGCALRLPCLRRTETEYPCPKLSRYTDEEVEVQEAEMDDFVSELLTNIPIARSAIMEHLARINCTKQNASGRIKCPVCAVGNLWFQYAGSYNGHISAQCSTDGCVGWQE